MLAVVVAGFAWYVARLNSVVDAADHHLVDARRVRVVGRDWVPPDWEERIAAHLAALGPIDALEREALENAAAEIATLPFVEDVGEVTTVWPDGIAIDVLLRRPRACVRSGERYLLLAEDGTVLPGIWSLPPDTGAGRLPVLGPFDWSTEDLAPGDRLHDPAVQDGIAIATSLFDHLAIEDRDRLGIVLIDARDARAASVENPGAQLWLEGRRLLLFGRAPNADAPGELPVETKWQHLVEALDLLEGPAPEDWDLLDVRWDRAVLRPRVSPEDVEPWEPR